MTFICGPWCTPPLSEQPAPCKSSVLDGKRLKHCIGAVKWREVQADQQPRVHGTAQQFDLPPQDAGLDAFDQVLVRIGEALGQQAVQEAACRRR